MTDAGLTKWGQLMGSLLGGAVVMAGLFGMVQWKKRRRKLRQERAPQPEKVLRPPGHHVGERLDSLHDELLSAVMQTIFAGVIAAPALVAFYPLVVSLIAGRVAWTDVWKDSRAFMIYCVAAVGSAAVVWLVWGFFRVSRLVDGIHGWRFGLRGEQAVADKLADPELAKAGYVVFHDIPAESGERRWNVDHVVVGPGGIFVLETKTRPRRKATRDQAEDKVLFDGVTLQFPWCYDRKAAQQAEANARWVKGIIAKYAPENVMVQPVIALPGWWVEGGLNHAVWALNPKGLVTILVKRKGVLTPQELEPIVARLDEECRVLEF